MIEGPTVMRKNIAAIIAGALALTNAAHAATSIYTDSSNFGGWADATNSSGSLGGENGVSASVPNGGWIAYGVAPAFTIVSARFFFTAVSGNSTALFYVGRTNGAGWFSALSSIQINLVNGVNEISSTALTNYCIGLGGCDVVVFQAWNNSAFAVDSVIARTPEPSIWALMIFGFIGIAWRVKSVRRDSRLREHAAAPV